MSFNPPKEIKEICFYYPQKRGERKGLEGAEGALPAGQCRSPAKPDPCFFCRRQKKRGMRPNSESEYAAL
jgi:hypothetical protein